MKVKEKLEALAEVARDAVAHVGRANYQERENEAMRWIEDALDRLLRDLPPKRDETL